MKNVLLYKFWEKKYKIGNFYDLWNTSLTYCQTSIKIFFFPELLKFIGAKLQNSIDKGNERIVRNSAFKRSLKNSLLESYKNNWT